MRKLFILALVLLTGTSLRADEGMWLPSLIGNRIADMQAKGFKLSAEDIYSVNQASLKDAVVLFGGGCTGEMISSQGLLVTNHHCGYGAIQRLSSVEHDYLKDGFWAIERNQELPCKGLTVSFLDRMEDVTSVILKDYKEGMSESEREALVKSSSEALIKEVTSEGKGLKASVEALFYGNQYFLFVYRVFSDLRLVGAPPSSIGKFGGDTDNWMWPRHTGDFSMFRVYASPDNEPAEYSENNVPYTPKRHFKISLQGVKEGDFTFIYGFPGSTQEYIHSEGVRYISELSDPVKIALRTKRLDIQKKYMSLSQAVRIQYSSKNASVSNAWKKWQGEVGGIERNHIVMKKKFFEKGFCKWAEGGKYEGLVERLDSLYTELEPYKLASDWFNESLWTCELTNFAWAYSKGRASKESFYKDYYLPIDKECFISVLNEYAKADVIKPQYFTDKLAAYGSIEAWADDLFTNSVFTKGDIPEDYKNDPAYEYASTLAQWYNEVLLTKTRQINSEITLAYRDYMRGQMEFQKEKDFYPDANLTLRVAYGNIEGYSPSDAVYYSPSSTLSGIIEKDNPEIFDYNIPQVLRDIYAEGGYEDTPVCFLATNHTTGGNSGSPVINADGNLIGINFDRVWEGTMSDIAFDPSFCRNISLDIRYLVFVIDKVGGAGKLLEEMEFVR